MTIYQLNILIRRWSLIYLQHYPTTKHPLNALFSAVVVKNWTVAVKIGQLLNIQLFPSPSHLDESNSMSSRSISRCSFSMPWLEFRKLEAFSRNFLFRSDLRRSICAQCECLELLRQSLLPHFELTKLPCLMYVKMRNWRKLWNGNWYKRWNGKWRWPTVSEETWNANGFYPECRGGGTFDRL